MISEKELQERKEYNAGIGKNVPDVIKNGTLPGDYVIIQRYKFVDDFKTDTGIIEPLMQQYHTEGGRASAKSAAVEFQARGVVVKVGDGENAQKYKEGQILWWNWRNNSGNFNFLYTKDKAVVQGGEFVRMPVQNIEFIEGTI